MAARAAILLRRCGSSRFMQRLAEILANTPDHFGWSRFTWTRELLCRRMQLEGFPLVAVCTMGRCLARIGARLGMPKPIVLCPWPRDARERRLAELRALESRATATEPVLYCDEVDININLNPKIGRDWMLAGHQRRVVTPGKNKKFYIAGGLDVRTGRLITTGAEHKSTGQPHRAHLARPSRERHPKPQVQEPRSTARPCPPVPERLLLASRRAGAGAQDRSMRWRSNGAQRRQIFPRPPRCGALLRAPLPCGRGATTLTDLRSPDSVRAVRHQ
jgi:hypothetical protein